MINAGKPNRQTASRVGRLVRDISALPLRQAGRLLFQKASRPLAKRRREASAVRAIHSLRSDLALTRSADENSDALLVRELASGFPVSVAEIRAAAKTIRQHFPNWIDRCVKEADAICAGTVSLLGHPVQLSDPPAWNRDCLSGFEWPLKRCSELAGCPKPDGADIKFVWELSRFHHGVTLGRAYALTGQQKYAQRFVQLFSNWVAVNPPLVGPNWLCPMEIGIRAVNLIWSAALISGSSLLDHSFARQFAESILAHGVVIYNNLEYTERVVDGRLEPVNGNHYFANIAALLHISCAFPGCRFSAEWRKFAQSELFREIDMQVDEDGVHWEYSPGYHRLIAEMALHCLILLERESVEIPFRIREKVRRMLEFIRTYHTPSGAVPLVRDIDNGRFCILGDPELENHDHVLALGALFFNRPDFFPGNMFEDCFWLLGSRVEQSLGKSAALVPAPESRLFRASGFCVMRNDSFYIMALACPKGMRGFCGHTHNDFLSFSVEVGGHSLIVDPGSYVYTQSPQWRNHFRSTSSHNTVTIDRMEQNEFPNNDLFEIGNSVEPVVCRWQSDCRMDVLQANYAIKFSAGNRITHERTFIFLKNENLLFIRDQIIGRGQRTVETRFHFGSGVEVALNEMNCVTAFKNGSAIGFLIAFPDPRTNFQFTDAWLSPRYGVKSRCTCVISRSVESLPVARWYAIGAGIDYSHVRDCHSQAIEILSSSRRSDEFYTAHVSLSDS